MPAAWRLGSVLACSALSIALPFPFLALELSHVGLSLHSLAIFFALTPLAVFLGALLVGSLTARSSPSVHFTLLRCSLPLNALTQIALGLLPSSRFCSPWMLLSLRTLQGLAISATNTSIYAIVASRVPRDLAAYSTLEACSGLGWLGGPLVGGVIYHLLGYPAPFLVCSTIILVQLLLLSPPSPPSTPLLAPGAPSSRAPSLSSSSPISLLHSPISFVPSPSPLIPSAPPSPTWPDARLAIGLLLPFVVEVTFGQTQPYIIVDIVQRTGLGVGLSSLLLACSSVMYTTGCVLARPLLHRLGRTNAALLCMPFYALGWVLQSPGSQFPWLTIGPAALQIALARALLGFLSACMFVASFPLMLEAFPGGEAAWPPPPTGLLAGLWNSACALGQLTGPLVGAEVLKRAHQRYDVLGVVTAAFSLGAGFTFAVLALIANLQQRFRNEQYSYVSLVKR